MSNQYGRRRPVVNEVGLIKGSREKGWVTPFERDRFRNGTTTAGFKRSHCGKWDEPVKILRVNLEENAEFNDIRSRQIKHTPSAKLFKPIVSRITKCDGQLDSSCPNENKFVEAINNIGASYRWYKLAKNIKSVPLFSTAVEIGFNGKTVKSYGPYVAEQYSKERGFGMALKKLSFIFGNLERPNITRAESVFEDMHRNKDEQIVRNPVHPGELQERSLKISSLGNDSVVKISRTSRKHFTKRHNRNFQNRKFSNHNNTFCKHQFRSGPLASKPESPQKYTEVPESEFMNDVGLLRERGKNKVEGSFPDGSRFVDDDCFSGNEAKKEYIKHSSRRCSKEAERMYEYVDTERYTRCFDDGDYTRKNQFKYSRIPIEEFSRKTLDNRSNQEEFRCRRDNEPSYNFQRTEWKKTFVTDDQAEPFVGRLRGPGSNLITSKLHLQEKQTEQRPVQGFDFNLPEPFENQKTDEWKSPLRTSLSKNKESVNANLIVAVPSLRRSLKLDRPTGSVQPVLRNEKVDISFTNLIGRKLDEASQFPGTTLHDPERLRIPVTDVGLSDRRSEQHSHLKPFLCAQSPSLAGYQNEKQAMPPIQDSSPKPSWQSQRLGCPVVTIRNSVDQPLASQIYPTGTRSQQNINSNHTKLKSPNTIYQMICRADAADNEIQSSTCDQAMASGVIEQRNVGTSTYPIDSPKYNRNQIELSSETAYRYGYTTLSQTSSRSAETPMVENETLYQGPKEKEFAEKVTLYGLYYACSKLATQFKHGFEYHGFDVSFWRWSEPIYTEKVWGGFMQDPAKAREDAFSLAILKLIADFENDRSLLSAASTTKTPYQSAVVSTGCEAQPEWSHVAGLNKSSNRPYDLNHGLKPRSIASRKASVDSTLEARRAAWSELNTKQRNNRDLEDNIDDDHKYYDERFSRNSWNWPDF